MKRKTLGGVEMIKPRARCARARSLSSHAAV